MKTFTTRFFYFEGLVKLMLENDINEAEKEKTLIKNNLLKPTWEYPKI